MAQSHTAKEISFQWKGKDKRGSIMAGEAMATGVPMLRAQLRNQGITLIKAKKKSKNLISLTRSKKISAQDICFFTRQFATMMQAGIPIMQALDIVGKGHSNPQMQHLMNQVKSDIEGGSSLADAIRKHPKYFDDLYCSLVDSGEQSGTLEQMIDRIATYKEKTESLKRKIKKAMFYPTAVLCVALIVTAILLIFVVPQFEDLFKGFNADLPAFTRLIINLSEFMQNYWWLVLFMLTGTFLVLKKIHAKSLNFRNTIDRLVLKIPIIGDILSKAAIARFARTLATTFAAGVPLVDALQSVAMATGNVVFKNAVMHIREFVTTGQQMQIAMRDSNIFPAMVIQMVGIGEESGSLDSMLAKVANIYEEEVDLSVDSLSSLLEPMIMVILGVLVGGLVVAMYLPIFKMGSVI